MSRGLAELVYIYRCAGSVAAEDTKAVLAKLVLRTPCARPADSEFGGGIGLSGQTEEKHTPKSPPV